MKFFILDTYYDHFLQWFYKTHPKAVELPYDQQQRILMNQCFGTSDFYSKNLQSLGHNATDAIANNEILQHQWATEKGIPVERKWKRPRLVWTRKGFHLQRKKDTQWLFDILVSQIECENPDILYIQNMDWVTADFLKKIRPNVDLIVGQHATTVLLNLCLDYYDLILSAAPNIVSHFQSKGYPAKLLKLGFEQKILSRIPLDEPLYDLIHIGGYSPLHAERNSFLEDLGKKVNIDFWGYGHEHLPHNSAIRKRFHGEIWGLEMYRLLQQSKITVTGHISSVAGNFAGNMRLYEATGVGTLLITDAKENLPELFEPGKEVIIYHSPDECAELVRYYLENDEERKKIARAGQQRTLKEHTYNNRMRELVTIIKQNQKLV